MSWPDGERYLFPEQCFVIIFLLSLVSTFLFSRTGSILSHLNSSTRRFPRFPQSNLCFYVMLAVLSPLRCNGHSLLLSSYLSKIDRIKNPSCRACGHLSSRSALSSYGFFASVALWQFSVSLRPLVQALLSFPTSRAPWSSAINPSLGKGRVTTTTGKLKLQKHYYVTKRVSKFKGS